MPLIVYCCHVARRSGRPKQKNNDKFSDISKIPTSGEIETKELTPNNINNEDVERNKRK